MGGWVGGRDTPYTGFGENPVKNYGVFENPVKPRKKTIWVTGKYFNQFADCESRTELPVGQEQAGGWDGGGASGGGMESAGGE